MLGWSYSFTNSQSKMDWVISFTLRPLYLRRKNPCLLLNRKVGRRDIHCGSFRKRELLIHLSEIEPQFLCRSQGTVLTDLGGLLWGLWIHGNSQLILFGKCEPISVTYAVLRGGDKSASRSDRFTSDAVEKRKIYCASLQGIETLYFGFAGRSLVTASEIWVLSD